MPILSRAPHPVELDLSPAEVAAACAHLPGRVFFDTALEGADPGHISIVAASPSEVFSGSSDADWARLRAAVESRAEGVRYDHGLPCGFAAGLVEYGGLFHFGLYENALIFRHGEQRWFEIGDLRAQLRPAFTAPPTAGPRFTPQMSREHFCRLVSRAQEYIAAGDIYQVNLAQCFEAQVAGGSLFSLYEVLRDCSPAPMAAWMSLAGREVLCSSPETFLRMAGRAVETRPIKGTRPRAADPEEDSRLAYELQTSAKEIAELVMITDLLRNDLGQVCGFGSVRVEDMLRLERLEQVHHLVSTVAGELRPGVSHADALSACFPGGSITGAPKKRAREIIDVLERVPRGLYCGALGYFGFNGESQLNIVIRTLVREGGRVRCHTGAGIVADSEPAREYEETLHKAAGIFAAVQRWRKGKG